MFVMNFREVYKSVLNSFLPKVVVCASYSFSADTVYCAIFHKFLERQKNLKKNCKNAEFPVLHAQKLAFDSDVFWMAKKIPFLQ